MPLYDIVILALIVSVFAAFGGLMGWATWYSSPKRKNVRRGVDSRQVYYPSHANLQTDDD